MIELLEDRISCNRNKGEKLFLKQGAYPLKRIIPNLGWLVITNMNPRFSLLTIIRFHQGRRIVG